MPKLIDLTHEMYTDMPIFETEHIKTRPRVFIENRTRTTETPEYGSTTVCTTLCLFVDHTGTHVDSTIHFNSNGYGADKIPLDLMYADGVALHFQEKKAGEYIGVEDLEEACRKEMVEIRAGDVIVINTGRWKKWGTPDYVKDAVGVHTDGVRWLLNKGVRVYGIDSFTPDLGPNSPDHMLLKEIPHHIIENLTNLDGLPPRFKFIGLPLKLRGASGSPIRAVAAVGE